MPFAQSGPLRTAFARDGGSILHGRKFAVTSTSIGHHIDRPPVTTFRIIIALKLRAPHADTAAVSAGSAKSSQGHQGRQVPMEWEGQGLQPHQQREYDEGRFLQEGPWGSGFCHPNPSELPES